MKKKRGGAAAEGAVCRRVRALFAKWRRPPYRCEFASFKAAIGRTYCGQGVMKFSRPLWPRATTDEQRATVIHEVAHAIVGCKAGHGPVWQAQMRKMGIKSPQRTIRADIRCDVATISCCGKKGHMTKRKLTRVRKLDLRCLPCGTPPKILQRPTC